MNDKWKAEREKNNYPCFDKNLALKVLVGEKQ